MMQAMRNPKILKWGLYVILLIAVPSFVMLGPSFNSSNNPSQQLDFVEMSTKEGKKVIRNAELRDAQNRATFENAGIFGLVNGGNQQLQFEAYNLLPGYYNNNRMELAQYAVGSEAIREMARRSNLTVTPEQISKSLSQSFPTQADLDDFLKNSGMTQKEMIDNVTESQLLDLGQRQVVNIARASILESWLAYKNTNDRLQARFVKIPTLSLQQEIVPTERELEAFFAKNADNYIDPEKRVYRYVSVPAPALPPPITVSPSEIEQYYNTAEKVGNPLYQAPVGKIVRHITVNLSDVNTTETVTTQLKEIRQLIADGGDFAKIANEFTQDPANIRFGATTELLGGRVPGNVNDSNQASFAQRYGQTWLDEVNKLEVGQLSDVIMGNNFMAIAEVTSLSDGIMTLEDATPIIEALIRDEKQKESDAAYAARNEAVNALEAKIKRLAAESTTLESIATKLETSVGETSPTVSTATFIRPIGNLSEYREYLNELEPNIPSQVLRAANTDNFVILEINEVIASRPQTLAEVRPIVEAAVKREKATARAKEIADQIAEIARTAEDGIDSAMEQLPELKETYTVQDTVEPFGRLSPPAELQNFQTLPSLTFRSKKGDVLVLRAGSAEYASEFVVLELTSVEEPDKEKFLNEIGTLEQNLTGLKQITYVQEFRSDAPKVLKPKYNRELLEPEVRERNSRRRRGAN